MPEAGCQDHFRSKAMVSELVVKGSLSKASPLPKVGHLTFCRYTCYLPRDTSCISGIFARFDMVKDHCAPPPKKTLLNSKKPTWPTWESRRSFAPFQRRTADPRRPEPSCRGTRRRSTGPGCSGMKENLKFRFPSNTPSSLHHSIIFFRGKFFGLVWWWPSD